MEAVVATAFGFVLALLVALVLELRELRRSVDHARQMIGDAVGVPIVDSREIDRRDEGTVSIPYSLRDMLSIEDPEREQPDDE